MKTTSELQILPSPYGSQEFNAFLQLPWAINKNNPLWTPPIISMQRKILDPKRGSFFEHGQAEYYIALRDGQPVGRISAHINRLHDVRYNDNMGFFGFFECFEDKEAAKALLDQAKLYLSQNGRTKMRGPLSFAIYDEVGVLIEGFDSPPAIMHTHNMPYYDELLVSAGLAKAVDWFALCIDNRDVNKEEMNKRLNEIMTQQNLTMTKGNPTDLVKRFDEILTLFNETWDGNWGHVPFTRKQFKEVVNMLLPLLRTDLIRFILDSKGNVVAFIVTLAELTEQIRNFNGDLGLINKAKLFWEARFRPLRNLRTILLGVKREYQNRHLHHALILSTYLNLLEHPKACFCDLSLISEPLRFFIRALEKYGARKYKTWRVYDIDI